MASQPQPQSNNSQPNETNSTAETIRLPDLELWAGPREIMFEPELPKGGKFSEDITPRVEMVSSDPEILSFGEPRFEYSSVRFMIPATAVREGEVTVNYRIDIGWDCRDGETCRDQRVLTQKVYVLEHGGATVPWVHYHVTETD